MSTWIAGHLTRTMELWSRHVVASCTLAFFFQIKEWALMSSGIGDCVIRWLISDDCEGGVEGNVVCSSTGGDW